MSATMDHTPGSGPEPLVDEPLTITDFVRYQGASGDMNPIHHDAAFAALGGYPSPFAVGMLAAGILSGYLADWLGPENIRRLKVQFREQAWPGDVLTYSAEVTEVRQREGEELVDVDATCTRQTGGVHVSTSATFALPIEE